MREGVPTGCGDAVQAVRGEEGRGLGALRQGARAHARTISVISAVLPACCTISVIKSNLRYASCLLHTVSGGLGHHGYAVLSASCSIRKAKQRCAICT